ncbi:GNAT family N-acetyltransferase [Austwickia sp. TVS 96-490-7B]|uniref:GNAT family N-acetyltransferase n=1 Tax=Austwickia sp. TVS 96-490-7B TaxID=2830843 RepID=UPI001C564F90|nr:GNAT family protein [Austwickia sp. TVS 96-490-7B]
MSDSLDGLTLIGDHVVLTPLRRDDHDGLCAAVRDGELWRLPYATVPSPETMSADIDAKLAAQAAGTLQPFVVRRADGADPTCHASPIVGSTSFYSIDDTHRNVMIGYTWYAASMHRTAVNTESKLLLLTHAFEAEQRVRVEFRTHWLNRQSRAAIERLGATHEGALRQHQLMPDGSWRNTCVYAILAHEWPAVRAELRRRLQVSTLGK